MPVMNMKALEEYLAKEKYLETGKEDDKAAMREVLVAFQSVGLDREDCFKWMKEAAQAYVSRIRWMKGG